MKTSKTRRESGRKYNKFYKPEQGFYNEQYWDDWDDYRDGYRDVASDTTKKKPTHIKKERWSNKILSRNKKINKKNKIREARKKSPKWDNFN